MHVNVGPIKGRTGAYLDVELSERLESPWDGNVVFVEPVQAKVRVVNTGNGYVATGDASARASIVCDRCLEPFPAYLEARFEQEFRKFDEPQGARAGAGEAAAPGERREEDDDYRAFDGDTIDLDETVLEAFLLAAPVKFVCREDCRGICPRCGTNLNAKQCSCEAEAVDPRLAELAKLLDPEGHD
mgnify:CR=1 FL=1